MQRYNILTMDIWSKPEPRLQWVNRPVPVKLAESQALREFQPTAIDA
jgi:hypothetical protein